jgi:hypothetical protein
MISAIYSLQSEIETVTSQMISTTMLLAGAVTRPTVVLAGNAPYILSSVRRLMSDLCGFVVLQLWT